MFRVVRVCLNFCKWQCSAELAERGGILKFVPQFFWELWVLLNQLLLLLLLLLLGYADAVSSAAGTSSGMLPFRFLSYICPSSISKVFFFFLRSSSISKVATEKKG